MKLSISSETKTVSIDVLDDIDIFEIIEEICNLLMAYGYHPESVKEGISGMAEQYEEENESDKHKKTL